MTSISAYMLDIINLRISLFFIKDILQFREKIMGRKVLPIVLMLILSSIPIYGKDASGLKNELLSYNAEASNEDNLNNNSKKKEHCYNILGFAYVSCMFGTAIGAVSGLFWAFYNKNKTVSMGFCISGCCLFVIGATVGIVAGNTYCKSMKMNLVEKLFEKYDFQFSYNYDTKDYKMAFSCKI
jgi:hypothetical protein